LRDFEIQASAGDIQPVNNPVSQLARLVRHIHGTRGRTAGGSILDIMTTPMPEAFASLWSSDNDRLEKGRPVLDAIRDTLCDSISQESDRTVMPALT